MDIKYIVSKYGDEKDNNKSYYRVFSDERDVCDRDDIVIYYNNNEAIIDNKEFDDKSIRYIRVNKEEIGNINGNTIELNKDMDNKLEYKEYSYFDLNEYKYINEGEENIESYKSNINYEELIRIFKNEMNIPLMIEIGGSIFDLIKKNENIEYINFKREYNIVDFEWRIRMNGMIDVIKEDSRYEYLRGDIELPLYQFNRSRYWIDKPKSNSCIDDDIDKLNYTISWNETSFQTNSLPTNNVLCIAYKKYENNNDYILVPEQNDIITSVFFHL